MVVVDLEERQEKYLLDLDLMMQKNLHRDQLV